MCSILKHSPHLTGVLGSIRLEKRLASEPRHPTLGQGNFLKNRALHIVVVGLAAVVTGRAQVGGFGGPSILSRGGGGMGTSRGQAIGISAYGSVQGIYNLG